MESAVPEECLAPNPPPYCFLPTSTVQPFAFTETATYISATLGFFLFLCLVLLIFYLHGRLYLKLGFFEAFTFAYRQIIFVFRGNHGDSLSPYKMRRREMTSANGASFNISSGSEVFV